MESAWTRLVNIGTGEISIHHLHNIPSYIAVSHTWADRRFPVGRAFGECPGAEAVRSLSATKYSNIEYCWSDTLCIDQESDADKERQIPLMGDIYSKATVVAIILAERLGISQEMIDKVTRKVTKAIDMSLNGTYLEHGSQWSSSEKRRHHLIEAMDLIELFTRPAWGTRVWTMQEYILARQTVWIDGDYVLLFVPQHIFHAIPDVCDQLSIEECLVPKYSKLYSHFMGMAAPDGMRDRTRVMELLGNRKATVPEDEVYGLMGASGVVLEDTSIKGKEKVWELWWEKAVNSGHLRWALLPPAVPIHSADKVIIPSRSCVMPSFEMRWLASTNSGLDAVDGFDTASVREGTLLVSGRTIGKIIKSYKMGPVLMDNNRLVSRDLTLVIFAAHKWSRALRMAAAFGGGRFSPQHRMLIAQVLISHYCRAKLCLLRGNPSSFTVRFQSQLQAFIWSEFLMLQSISMRPLNDSIAWLVTVQGAVSTDLVIVTDGETVGVGDIALDLGALDASGRSQLTIIGSRRAGTENETHHRVGTSLSMQKTEDIAKATKFACLMAQDSTPLERFEIGGQKCPECISKKTGTEQSKRYHNGDSSLLTRKSPTQTKKKAVIDMRREVLQAKKVTRRRNRKIAFTIRKRREGV